MYFQNFVNVKRVKENPAWSETYGVGIRVYLGFKIVIGASPRHQYKDYWRDSDSLGCAASKQ